MATLVDIFKADEVSLRVSLGVVGRKVDELLVDRRSIDRNVVSDILDLVAESDKIMNMVDDASNLIDAFREKHGDAALGENPMWQVRLRNFERSRVHSMRLAESISLLRDEVMSQGMMDFENEIEQVKGDEIGNETLSGNKTLNGTYTSGTGNSGDKATLRREYVDINAPLTPSHSQIHIPKPAPTMLDSEFGAAGRFQRMLKSPRLAMAVATPPPSASSSSTKQTTTSALTAAPHLQIHLPQTYHPRDHHPQNHHVPPRLPLFVPHISPPHVVRQQQSSQQTPRPDQMTTVHHLPLNPHNLTHNMSHMAHLSSREGTLLGSPNVSPSTIARPQVYANKSDMAYLSNVEITHLERFSNALRGNASRNPSSCAVAIEFYNNCIFSEYFRDYPLDIKKQARTDLEGLLSVFTDDLSCYSEQNIGSMIGLVHLAIKRGHIFRPVHFPVINAVMFKILYFLGETCIRSAAFFSRLKPLIFDFLLLAKRLTDIKPAMKVAIGHVDELSKPVFEIGELRKTYTFAGRYPYIHSVLMNPTSLETSQDIDGHLISYMEVTLTENTLQFISQNRSTNANSDMIGVFLCCYSRVLIANKRHKWPDSHLLRNVTCNGAVVPLQRCFIREDSLRKPYSARTYIGLDEPCDLTEYLQPGSNTIRLYWKPRDPNLKDLQYSDFCFSFEVVEWLRKEKAIATITDPDLVLPKKDEIALVNHYCSNTPIPERYKAHLQSRAEIPKSTYKSDINGEGTAVKLSLLNRFTLGRIARPVRGICCPHFDCFDLNTFLEMNASNPRMQCPFIDGCGRHLTIDKIKCSVLVNDIFAKSSRDFDTVLITSGGAFKATTEVLSSTNYGNSKRKRILLLNSDKILKSQSEDSDDTIPPSKR